MDGGPELHVGKPEAAHDGDTHAGVGEKGVSPNVIPSQYSMTTIVS
jgi:hypothetical protein